MSAVREGRVPAGLKRGQLARWFRDDLRAREAERERLTMDLGREALAMARGDGDEERVRDVEALLAEVERAIRLDRAALDLL